MSHETAPTTRALMSRRLPFVFAVLLVFAVAAMVWREFTARSPQSATATAPGSLAADAAILTAPPGKWQSDVVKITTRNGMTYEEILEIQFNATAPGGQSNPPDAQAGLFISSPKKGIPHLMEANASFGDANFRDVHLSESNGVRTITITRAVDANDPNPAKKQRIYDRYYSVSLRYQLKNGVLILKGFPTTKPVNWGVSEFTVPKEEITFKVVR